MAYLTLPMTVSQYYPCYPSSSGMQACMDPFACKMKVEGEGNIKVQPDMAVVILAVTTENKQLKLAQEENAVRINKVIDTLTKTGIPPEDIQTQSYTINPQYDYIEGKQIFRGYRVVHSLRVTIRDMDKIGEIIDNAVESGVNQVSGIYFSLADPSRYYQQALRSAVDDALAKSKTLGHKLKLAVSEVPVQIVEENYQSKEQKVPVLLQAAETTTQIQPGQIEVTAKIKAVFSYIPLHDRRKPY